MYSSYEEAKKAIENLPSGKAGSETANKIDAWLAEQNVMTFDQADELAGLLEKLNETKQWFPVISYE